MTFLALDAVVLGNVLLFDDRFETPVNFGDVFAQGVVERVAEVVDGVLCQFFVAPRLHHRVDVHEFVAVVVEVFEHYAIGVMVEEENVDGLVQGGHFHIEFVVVGQHDVGVVVDNDGTEFVGGYDKLAADVLLNDF